MRKYYVLTLLVMFIFFILSAVIFAYTLFISSATYKHNDRLTYFLLTHDVIKTVPLLSEDRTYHYLSNSGRASDFSSVTFCDIAAIQLSEDKLTTYLKQQGFVMKDSVANLWQKESKKASSLAEIKISGEEKTACITLTVSQYPPSK